MIAYKIESTIEGILCAIYESFTLKEKPISVFSGDFQTTFGCKIKDINSYKPYADRVKKGIVKIGGYPLINTLFFPLRSGDNVKENVIFNACYKCLQIRKDLTENYADIDMLALFDLTRQITLEIHHAHGFIRFEKTRNGVLYSHFTPDNNIIDLVMPHFVKRMPNEKLIIHDLRRNLVCLYDGKKTIEFTPTESLTINLEQDELEMQSLWKTYFNSVAIKERENKKLQTQWLPKKYQKDMVEFN